MPYKHDKVVFIENAVEKRGTFQGSWSEDGRLVLLFQGKLKLINPNQVLEVIPFGCF